MISQRLKSAVKKCGRRQYQLARAIGISHSTLSCWLCDISDVRHNDPRVLKLGEILSVPADACFEEGSVKEVGGPNQLPESA